MKAPRPSSLDGRRRPDESARSGRPEDRSREAEQLYRRSLAIFSEAYAPDHPNRVKVVEELAGLLRDQGREQEAKQLESTEAMLRSTTTADHGEGATERDR